LKNKYFLWPENSIFRGIASSYKFVGTEQIENLLQKMFPSGYPVLCSSGRAALTLALEQSNASRRDLVGLFPYASHCVIDAVARISTPLSGPTAFNADLRIVYHQWGYVQEKNLPVNTIEDCVDTLCVRGTELFPGGGSFEVWSLPKILGTTSGGILWCKNEKAAEEIRGLRNNRKGGFLQWVLRLISKNNLTVYNYWQGSEASCGRISIWQNGEILKAIENWDTFVADRFEKLELMWPMTVDFLEKPVNRLPSVVPIDCLISVNEIVEIGLTAGTRMIEQLKPDGSRMINKVLPIPIHQDLSLTELKRIVNFLKINNK
jgi:putative PLP-dependent aminotransferase (TIGR04422 family)